MKKKYADIGDRFFTKKYVLIKVPSEHKSPSANNMGWEYEHRYIMEKHLGRYLEKSEVVHHKDGNKHNNNINNLKIMEISKHSQLHSLGGRIFFALIYIIMHFLAYLILKERNMKEYYHVQVDREAHELLKEYRKREGVSMKFLVSKLVKDLLKENKNENI